MASGNGIHNAVLQALSMPFALKHMSTLKRPVQVYPAPPLRVKKGCGQRKNRRDREGRARHRAQL